MLVLFVLETMCEIMIEIMIQIMTFMSSVALHLTSEHLTAFRVRFDGQRGLEQECPFILRGGRSTHTHPCRISIVLNNLEHSMLYSSLWRGELSLSSNLLFVLSHA